MKKRSTRWTPGRIVAPAVVLWLTPLLHGQVVTDGSLGAATSLGGPDIQVPHTLGRLRGSNLFHSFSQFNVQAGQTATFTGPESVQNVLSRVTGGTRSTIAGTLRVEGMPANFYLLNPSGVLVTTGAQLDVPGAFVVSTAQTLTFADGTQFLTTGPGPADALLSSASPAAFGFLSPTPHAGVDIVGAELTVQPGRPVVVVSGPVQLQAGQITAPGGQVLIAAVQGAGSVVVDPASANPITVEGVQADDIRLAAGSGLNVDGPGPGRIALRGRRIDLDQSLLSAAALAFFDGGGIHLQASQSIQVGGQSQVISASAGDVAGGPIVMSAPQVRIVSRAKVQNLTAAGGAGGDIIFTADELHVEGEGALVQHLSQFETGVITVGLATASGDIGDIRIDVKQLRVINAGQITAATIGPSQGGDISVNASESVLIDGKAAQNTGILAGPSQPAPDAYGAPTGDGGNIVLVTPDLRVLSGGQIDSGTQTAGNGGNIDITAGRILMDGLGSRFPTSIDVNVTTESVFGGSAGDISIHADSLELRDGGRIIASTFAAGSAGNIDIVADNILVDGAGHAYFTSISSTALGNFINPLASTGNAGNINIEAGRLRLMGGGQIGASALNNGLGGEIAVRAEHLIIDRQNVDSTRDVIPFARSLFLTTGMSNVPEALINAALLGKLALVRAEQVGDINAETLGFARAGNIKVVAGQLEMHNGGLISAQTFGHGAAGSIAIQAGTLRADTGSAISSRAIDPASAGAGGDVNVRASAVQLRSGARIDAESRGGGDAGGITIEADRIDLQAGLVTVQARQARAGDINMTAGRSIRINASQVTAASAAQDGGNVALLASRVDVRDSLITAQAGADGGAISILPAPAVQGGRTGPFFVVLSNSVINGLSGGTPVLVTVDGNAVFIRSVDSQILTQALSIPPEVDVAQSLAQLRGVTAGSLPALAQTCGARFSQDTSSFIIATRPSLPVEADSWLPVFGVENVRGAGSQE